MYATISELKGKKRLVYLNRLSLQDSIRVYPSDQLVQSWSQLVVDFPHLLLCDMHTLLRNMMRGLYRIPSEPILLSDDLTK